MDKVTISKGFYFARILFLFCIVCAHLVIPNEPIAINHIFARLFCIGVPGFLFTSGFFSSAKANNSIKLFFIKIIKILVPWLFLGGLIVLFEIRNNISFHNFVLHFFGFDSFLYYIPIYLIILGLYFLIDHLKNNVLKLVLDFFFIALSISSIILTCLNIIPYAVTLSDIPFHSYSCYLVVSNWIGFFALGRVIKYFCFFEKVSTRKNIICCISLFVVLLVLILSSNKFDIYFSYFSYFSFAIEITGVLLFVTFSLLVAKNLADRFKSIIIFSGSNTYFVYLVHMPLASLLSKLGLGFFSIFLSPLLIALIYLLLFGIIFLSSFIKAENIVCLLLGAKKGCFKRNEND